mgnify:CR=1 FL=1
MPNRAFDWFRQAKRDLEQARDSKRAGRHEYACFAAQQSAEKAVKALHLHLGQEAWGHVVAKLLRELPGNLWVPPDLINKTRVLDSYYIPPRYPYCHCHPELTPFEHYGELQSREAIRYADEVFAFVSVQMA